ncbi:ABC transporter permease [uncultured Mitsuokella sp.]|uniref:ABC transporter permease n=1 Tax=uncultured Mitsuokella sp. TaxID=453120 RepID=UPI0026228A27|nr:ABC transporter permease [uncultured Mitsuokella sp.]
MKQRVFIPQGSISKHAYTVLAVLTFAFVFFAWFFLTNAGIVDPSFMPTPQHTVDSAVQLFETHDFIKDIGISTYRVLAGFLISAVVALPLGLLIGTYAPIDALIEPLMSFVRYLPATAFIPLFILWIGIDESEKIALIIMGSLPQLLLMVAVDVRKVPHDLVEVSYTLGTKPSHVLWKIILPASMPHILDSLRMVLGWAWTYVVVAEMVGASAGIGYMMIQSQRMLNVGNIFVGLLAIGLLGLFFDCVFKLMNKVFFRWSE